MPGSEAEAVAVAAGGDAVGLIAQIEVRLTELVSGHPEPIGPWVEGVVTAGGKRLRPLLAVVCAGPEPGEPDAVVRAGVAVELLHAATLVHDDVIDGADTRRGIPTVFAGAGREMAVAAGDLLFAVALGELVASGSEAVSDLAEAGADLARGELLQRADAWQTGVTEQRYLERCGLKTARLFEVAARLGAVAGGRDPEPFERFARSVGLSFQLLDDVLDVTGPVERTGKPRGADLLDGTVTLPWIVAARRDQSLADVDLRALDAASALGICERIEATGALDDVRSTARGLADEAHAIADGVAEPTSTALHLIATAMVERSS